MTTCYPRGSGTVADKACGVNDIPDYEILIRAAKVVLQVHERVHNVVLL